MIRIHLWVTAIVAVTMLCLTGCKKETPLWSMETPPPAKQEVNSVIKIIGTNFTSKYKLEADSSLLGVTNSKKSGEVISFYRIFYSSPNQPAYLDFGDKDYLLSHTKYTVNAKGEVIRGDVYNLKTDGWDYSTTTLKAYYTLTYNNSGQLTQVSYFHADGQKDHDEFFEYTPEGNISRIRSSDNMILEYDNFNGIGKYVKYAHLFYIEGGDPFLFYNKNNPVKLNQTSRTYKYNRNKYPVEMAIKYPDSTSVFKIEYNVE